MITTLKTIWRSINPPNMTQVLVARHGQSLRNKGLGSRVHFDNHNELNEFGAEPDYNVPLSEEGEFQAEKLGRYISFLNLTPDLIIHSGYKRTSETARIARAGMRMSTLPIFEEPLLRERETGYTSHMIKDEANSYFQWKQEYWDRTGRYLAVPPGGESYIAMCDGRVNTALTKLAKQYRGRRVLLVLHGGTNKCIHMEYSQMSLAERNEFCDQPWSNPKNCSFSLYRYIPQTNRMVTSWYAKTPEEL